MSINPDEFQKVIQDVQAWISAGGVTVVGYPVHDHDWREDGCVVATNPVIHHRECVLCGLRQERRGNENHWTFDVYENIGTLIGRLQRLTDA